MSAHKHGSGVVMQEPVIGDTVHYFKSVTPSTGPAVSGALQTHAALVLCVRMVGVVDLKVTSQDGDTYIVRAAKRWTDGAAREGCWTPRRPS